jgi:hypothetical protein
MIAVNLMFYFGKSNSWTTLLYSLPIKVLAVIVSTLGSALYVSLTPNTLSVIQTLAMIIASILIRQHIDMVVHRDEV